MPAIILILLAIVLSACAKSEAPKPDLLPPSWTQDTSLPQARATAKMAVLSECEMLKAAMQLTKRASGREMLSIVEGCPGYESVKPALGEALEAALFIKAAKAFPPVHVERGGAVPIRIFRRMIARGVPVSIARKVTFLPSFRAAVKAQS